MAVTTEQLLAECACSDQMSAAQIYGHHAAGELSLSHLALHRVTAPEDIGVEAALPPAFTAPPARKYPEPIDWQLVGIYGAAAAAFLWCLILSIH